MIRLLPAICKDCGISSERAMLSPYLDYQLCSKCIEKREKKFKKPKEKACLKKDIRENKPKKK